LRFRLVTCANIYLYPHTNQFNYRNVYMV